MSSTDDLLVLAPDAQDLLFRTARTTNAFTDEPVTDAQMRAVYDLVRWGPSTANGQPLRILLVRSPEARERLGAHMSEGNRAKTLAAPLVAVLAYDTDFHENLPRMAPALPDAKSWFEGSPEADAARARTAHESAALQAGYFIVGLRAAGLSAGPMGGFDKAGVDAEFFPDGRFKSFVVVNIGRPAEKDPHYPRAPRLDYDEVVQTV